ncbi:putative ribonuclease H-like domain-containing protein [Tanacetum coccineum]
MPDLEDASDTLPNDGLFNGAYDDDKDVGAVANFNNMDNTIVFKQEGRFKRLLQHSSLVESYIDYDKVFAPVARIEAIRLFLAFASYMGFTVYQMDVKSAFLIALFEEEVVEDGVDVDVHVYRSMIGSLMYLIASRPDIMYLKHQPKLGLWYPRDSPFELEAFSDSDYGGASLDRKSTTEYVAAANCCGVIKNPVAHSKTKHIEIRFHFIRDCYKKRLIEVIKIHIDSNVADLLTKGFDVTRFNFLVGNELSRKVTPLFDSMLVQQTEDEEGSSGNHGGQSSSDRSLSRNEDGLTLQSVYDLCISLCTHVSAQAKEIKALKAHVKKLKKGVKPLITHHKAWMKSVALKTRLCTIVHKYPAFDDLDDDEMDYMETKDAQDEGRTSSKVLEEKESADKEVSTKAPVSIVKPNKGTNKRNEGKSATQIAPTTTSTPTPTIFGDDETIAQVLITMSQNKQNEKEKGVEIRNVEDTERPRPTSTRSVLTLKPFQE